MDAKIATSVVPELSEATSDVSVRDQTLSASVVERSTLNKKLIERMFALYAKHYSDTAWSTFTNDLSSKTHVLLLRNGEDLLCGFTTLQLYETNAAGERLRVVFSGDTIIEPCHWGNNALAFEWLRFIGQVQRSNPTLPLYWLLIVKGHRTYRYLSTFALRYIPHHNHASSEQLTDLLNAIALEKFGNAFNPDTGIARFGPRSGRLNSQLADIPAAHLKREAVRFFVELNPDYRLGDELVCLCKVCEDNMRPLARRVFLDR